MRLLALSFAALAASAPLGVAATRKRRGVDHVESTDRAVTTATAGLSTWQAISDSSRAGGEDTLDSEAGYRGFCEDLCVRCEDGKHKFVVRDGPNLKKDHMKAIGNAMTAAGIGVGLALGPAAIAGVAAAFLVTTLTTGVPIVVGGTLLIGAGAGALSGEAIHNVRSSFGSCPNTRVTESCPAEVHFDTDFTYVTDMLKTAWNLNNSKEEAYAGLPEKSYTLSSKKPGGRLFKTNQHDELKREVCGGKELSSVSVYFYDSLTERTAKAPLAQQHCLCEPAAPTPAGGGVDDSAETEESKSDPELKSGDYHLL